MSGSLPQAFPGSRSVSFVSPKLVPQMAGTDRIWRSLQKKQGVRYSVLVLNKRGLEEAHVAGVPHVEIYVSASETHSMKNAHMTVEKALAEACLMVEQARGYGMAVTAGVMCAFGCHYEGAVPVEKVLEMAEALEEQNPTEIGLADTTGMAEPSLVQRIVGLLAKRVFPDRIALHLHDTRGLGLANLQQAVQMGVRKFDSSVGGLGGCPFIPGAPGNISTEAAVETVETLGYETGIDVAQIRLVAADLQELLGGTRAVIPIRVQKSKIGGTFFV